MKDLAEAELYELKDQIPALEHEIRLALLPKDEADARSAILEIRPAAGGDEAGLFAAELFAMYQKYADSKGWRFEILEYGDTGLGGIKEAVGRDQRPQRVCPAEIRIRACIACNAFRRRKARAASIPRPSPSLCCRKPRKSTSRSTTTT